MVAVVFFNPVLDQQSQKHLLKHWHPPAPLVYVGKVPPSAVFYANNQAVEVANLEALQTMLGPPPPSREQLMTAVMHQTVFDAMTSAQKINWQLVEQYGEYVMMRQAATISREP